jgi:hypothetical protein
MLPSGSDGVGITNVQIVENNLIITLTTGDTINAGPLPSAEGDCCSGILLNDFTTYSTSSNSNVQLSSYTLPANILQQNGDSLKVTCLFIKPTDTEAWIIYRVNGFDLVEGSNIVEYPISLTDTHALLEVELTRLSATTLKGHIKFTVSDPTNRNRNKDKFFIYDTVSTNNLTSLTNTMAVIGRITGVGNTLSLVQYKIEYNRIP